MQRHHPAQLVRLGRRLKRATWSWAFVRGTQTNQSRPTLRGDGLGKRLLLPRRAEKRCPERKTPIRADAPTRYGHLTRRAGRGAKLAVQTTARPPLWRPHPPSKPASRSTRTTEGNTVRFSTVSSPCDPVGVATSWFPRRAPSPSIGWPPTSRARRCPLRSPQRNRDRFGSAPAAPGCDSQCSDGRAPHSPPPELPITLRSPHTRGTATMVASSRVVTLRPHATPERSRGRALANSSAPDAGRRDTDAPGVEHVTVVPPWCWASRELGAVVAASI